MDIDFKPRLKIVSGLLALYLITGIPSTLQAADPYGKLARHLSKAASSLTNRKVAIIPFSYTDGRRSSGGTIIAERLTTQIVNLGKFEVIERSQLEKVLKELNLQVSGVVDLSLIHI